MTSPSSNSPNNPFSGYLAFRDKTDSESARIVSIHGDQIKCAPGCSSCCMNFRIFPVEFFSILHELAGRNPVVSRIHSGEQCVFLNDGLCSIYDSRPFICRTHGLPLLSMGEDGWELSHCELNFAAEDTDFDDENSFASDRFTSELFMINKEFISSGIEGDYSEFQLIELNSIKEYLDNDNREKGGSKE